MLLPLCCSTPFEFVNLKQVSPPAEQQSRPESQLEACVHVKLTGTEYAKRIVSEPAKFVTNSIVAQLQKVPPNDLTSSCLWSNFQFREVLFETRVALS